jgi:hypothetical protein
MGSNGTAVGPQREPQPARYAQRVVAPPSEAVPIAPSRWRCLLNNEIVVGLDDLPSCEAARSSTARG